MFIEILYLKYPNKKQFSPKIKTHNFGENFNSLGLDISTLSSAIFM